jgi:hypothetical protein
MTKPTARETALAQELVLQGRCFRLLMECSKMRSHHPNAAVGLSFATFAAQGLVCAHHPHLPPHFHCPLPLFFSQSLISANAAGAMAKLTWFHGQFAPFPEAIPLGAPRRSPTPDPTAPGTSAQGTAAATRRRTPAATSKDRIRGPSRAQLMCQPLPSLTTMLSTVARNLDQTPK